MQTNLGVVGYVRALFRGATAAGLSDAQLLERYCDRGGAEAAEHAFAAIVQRHGPMVLRACLAVARDRGDAEDAFQAAFLVLARRARSLWVRDSLGPWLHAVAVRVATDARDVAARRRRHERRYAELAATFVPAGTDDSDLRSVLHEEVARLPHKLRAPVVLCGLEGLTHEQAAGQLGWPVGTLKTRLTGARERLRDRLVRRGMGPAVALIADALAGEAAQAAVPAALARATVRAAVAVRLAAGGVVVGVVAASVESLVKGVLMSMMVSRIKIATVTVLAAGAVVGGAFACRGLFAGEPAVAKPDDPPAAKARPLEVTVVDKQTGRPVAGADVRVTAGDPETPASRGTTDQAGRHVLTPDPGSRSLMLQVRAEGYVPVRVGWNSRGTRGPVVLPASYTVPLERAASIGGVVKDPEGRPVAGATVFVIVAPGPAAEPGAQPRVDIWDEPCKSDAQGRWRCGLVPADVKSPILRVEHPDFVTQPVIGDDAPWLAGLLAGSHVTKLARGLPVSGRVLDETGKPVAGATVAQGPSLSDGTYRETKTDSQGGFRFGHARPGRLVLTARAKGHAPDLQEVDVAEGLKPLEFRLGTPRTVRGRVVDANGKPVAEALVVTDSWRGYRTLDTRTVTDKDGRFRVDDLPGEVVEFQFAREGYMNLPGQRLSPESEAVVTLTRPLVVRGTVTDAGTGRPVEDFTILEGDDPASGSDRWDREQARPFRGGRYEVTVRWPYPAVRGLRVEATDYLPATSRGFRVGEGEVTYDFKLTPGTVPSRPAVAGVVLLPDGTPAADAEVALAGKTFAPYVTNGRPSYPRHCPTTRTGRDGAFRFEPQTEPVAVLAFHDRGFAEATAAELEALPGHALRLTEWGRVEGTLRIGPGPGAGQEVHLNPKRPGDDREGRAPIFFQYQARTDDQGRFVFERVVPGPASVSRVVHTSPHSTSLGPWVPLDVRPGATTQVTSGGTGRPVVGRVDVSPDVKTPVDSTAIQSRFMLQAPPVVDPKFGDGTMSKEERLAWYNAWSVTDEGKAYLAYQQDRRDYALAVQRDGSFRVDDVVPGVYELTFRVFSAPNLGPGSRPAVEAKRTVTIGPIPGGRSDEPLDLGKIELAPP